MEKYIIQFLNKAQKLGEGIVKRLVIITLCLIQLTIAEGSRESDSLALVAIKEANPESTLDWDYSKPLDEWKRVTMLDGRVSGLGTGGPGIALSVLPKEIGFLTLLKALILEGGNLTNIPSEVGNLVNLEMLNINLNQLTTLPPEIGNLRNLEELHLSGNDLTVLPGEIGSLTNLKFLNINQNMLSKWPNELDQLTKLERLWFYENNFKTLPHGLRFMTELKDLSGNDNKIQYIPEEVFENNRFENIEYFMLYSNLLYSLPSSITTTPLNKESVMISFDYNSLNRNLMPKDIALWLDNNNSFEDWESSQKSLETDHLQIKKQLIPLQGENPESPLNWFILDTITEWSCITYDGFINDVIELKLNNKKLKKIPNSILGLTRLAVLDLSKNFIEALPENMGSYKYLRSIDLSHNDITILPEDIISLTPIHKLDVGYNNLKDIYMTNEMITWLDTYDPDWRDTQGLESVISTSKAVDHTPKMNVGKHTLSFSGPLAIDSRITIISPNGRVIFESALENNNIGIPVLSQGLYLVSLESQDKTYRFKFVR